MAARVANISVDCEDVVKVANFWAAVLGQRVDPGASAEWASIGGTDPTRAAPAWYFNRVLEPKVAKNRMHVDITSPEPGFVGELERWGATVVTAHQMAGGHSWTVLQDPEGNEFCVAARPFTG